MTNELNLIIFEDLSKEQFIAIEFDSVSEAERASSIMERNRMPYDRPLHHTPLIGFKTKYFECRGKTYFTHSYKDSFRIFVVPSSVKLYLESEHRIRSFDIDERFKKAYKETYGRDHYF